MPESIVERVISKVTTSIEDDIAKIRDRDLIARDILFYGLFLQDKHQKIVFGEWLESVGISDERQFIGVLDGLIAANPILEQNIIEEQPGQTYRFAEPLANAIRKGFFVEDSAYQVEAPLPYWQISGMDFLNLINLYPTQESTTPALALRAARALKQAVGLEYDETDYEHIYVLTGTDENNTRWNMLLCVYPFQGTLTREAYNQLINDLTTVEQDYPNAKMLMVVPSLDGGNADNANRRPRLYCMWDLSFVRFFHLLHKVLTHDSPTEGKQRRALAEQNWPKILRDGVPNSHAYLESQAINELRSLFFSR